MDNTELTRAWNEHFPKRRDSRDSTLICQLLSEVFRLANRLETCQIPTAQFMEVCEPLPKEANRRGTDQAPNPHVSAANDIIHNKDNPIYAKFWASAPEALAHMNELWEKAFPSEQRSDAESRL
jgi:hypothetical protein